MYAASSAFSVRMLGGPLRSLTLATCPSGSMVALRVFDARASPAAPAAIFIPAGAARAPPPLPITGTSTWVAIACGSLRKSRG
jgi:hypothetical protein